MIKFVVLAIIIVLVSWSLGALAGHSVGYQRAYREMLPIIENLEKLVNIIANDRRDQDGALQPSEEGDRKTP